MTDVDPRLLNILIREMRPDDARAFLEVHHQAVRGLAAADYPVEVIDAWAPMPITEKHVKFARANPGGEYRLIAELEGQIVGIGVLGIENSELRACYVAPPASRKGVGSALVRQIERVARERGLSFLEVDSSVNAEPLYASLGYEVRGHGEHFLANGQPMACVKMHKNLTP